MDDCGNIINPMIVDGQIHGGLSMGMEPALFEEISYDESGNVQGGSFMDYLMPGSMEIPITPEKVWRILKDKGVAE